MNAKKILSVRRQESSVVVEDVGSFQGECVRLLELEVENFPVIPFMSRLISVQRSAEKARLENLESIRFENASVAADLGVQWSVVCRDFIKAGERRPMPGECATLTADEADENVDVVGSSTSVHRDMESQALTFRESVSYAFLKNFGGVPDTSGIPLLNFLNNLIFTLLYLFSVDFTYSRPCKSF